MLRFLNQPYDLLQIPLFKRLSTFGFSIFIFVFLFLFEPFGLAQLPELTKLKIITMQVLAGLAISYLHLYVLQNYVFKRFTLGNTLLWISWIIFLVSISCFIINDLTFNDGRLHFRHLFIFVGIVFSTSTIPLCILILMHYAYVLKSQIRIANQINQKVSQPAKDSDAGRVITVMANNGRDNIAVNEHDLLYITSADNYVDVFYVDSDLVRHDLLRNTLNEIEKQTNAHGPTMRRCHKSYIINTSLVEELMGNASGYKVKLKNVEMPIPISRKYKDDVLGLLAR